MASIKAKEFEEKLLKQSSHLKTLVHRQFKTVPLTEDEVSENKQNFLIGVNALFDTAHGEARRLRKALAFLHADNAAMEEYFRKRGIPKPSASSKFTNPPHIKDSDNGTEGSGSTST